MGHMLKRWNYRNYINIHVSLGIAGRNWIFFAWLMSS